MEPPALLLAWRQAQRFVALVLDQIGFRETWWKGDTSRRPCCKTCRPVQALMRFHVVCGTTRGKTRLDALQRAGSQVLDLEALAQHRSWCWRHTWCASAQPKAL
jgi:tRNA 2-selenouridine synthase